MDHGKKSGKSIIFFYACMLLSSCMFSRGVFMLFLAQKGLSLAQIGLYQTMVQASMFLLEAPTGYLGDRIGKVRSLKAGNFLLLLHCILMILWDDPIPLIALGAVEGTGYTFCSGSDGALLYELLREKNREGDYLRLNTRLKAAQSVLTGITISLGAAVISYSWNLVYGITAVCLLLSLLFLAGVREPELPQEEKPDRKRDALSKIRRMICYPNLAVFLFCVVGFSCFDGISGSYYNFNQIIFQEKEISVTLVGVFFSVTYLANSAAYFLADALSRRISKGKLILSMLALQGALFAGLAVIRGELLFLAVSFLCCMVPEVVYILADSIVQANLASAYRATGLSLVSMLRSLASAVSYSLLGILLGRTQVGGFMLFLALTAFAALGGFALILIYGNRKKERGK